jgi:integrase
MNVTRICGFCKKEFTLPPNARKDQKYCSRECVYKSQVGKGHAVALDSMLQKNPEFKLFYEGLRSRATRRSYAYAIGRILGTDIDSFLTKDRMTRKSILENFIDKSNDAGNSDSFTKLGIAAIKSFLEQRSENDDGERYWKKIVQRIAESTHPSEDVGPSTDIIASFCNVIPYRDQVICVVATASGARVGGLMGLKVQDYKRLESGLGMLFVYRNSAKWRYLALVSVEAADMLDRYLELRANHGETITPQSPLFRDVYNPNDPASVSTVQPLSDRALTTKFERLWDNSGLRNGSTNGSRIREFKAVHCFRKTFETCLMGRLPEAMIERLLGHLGKGTIDNYYRTGDVVKVFEKPDSNAGWTNLVSAYGLAQESLAINERYRRKTHFEVKSNEQDSKIAGLYAKVEAQSEMIRAFTQAIQNMPPEVQKYFSEPPKAQIEAEQKEDHGLF